MALSADPHIAQAAHWVQVQLRNQDTSWGEFLRRGEQSASSFRAHVAHAQDAASILFSSGTTGQQLDSLLKPTSMQLASLVPSSTGLAACAHEGNTTFGIKCAHAAVSFRPAAQSLRGGP